MTASAVPVYAGSVFPGLRPFRPDEKILFFGREEHTDELLRRLEDTRFLAVVGLSGTGKSSLVQAGLVPALERGNLAGTGAHWRITIMKPGLDPLEALVHALNSTLGESDSRRALLRSGRLGLLEASRAGREPQENILIVVDQFEELFRFQRDRSSRSHEAQEFVALLLAAAREYSYDYRIYVVLTMRSDYLGECARFPGLVQALNEGQYLAESMTRHQLKDAIEGPAGLAGATVAPDVLDAMLDKAVGQQDQLPILQHLLMRMWAVRTGPQLTWAEYDHPLIGGWDNALDRHANSVLAELSEADQKVAKIIFQRLTERGEENRENRRPTQLRELAGVAGGVDDRVLHVVEHFRRDNCSFLTSPDPELDNQSVVDISHESLIRQWRRLSDWVEQESRSADVYKRLADAALNKRTLYRGPDLAEALRWKKTENHNQVWAARYAGDTSAYPIALQFLRSSDSRRFWLRLSALVAFVAALVFAVSFYWLYKRANDLYSKEIQLRAQTVRQDTALRQAFTAEKETAQREQEARTLAELQAVRAQSATVAAQQQAQFSLSGRLAITALQHESDQADLALLLAIESGRAARTFEARNALFTVLQSTSRLLTQFHQSDDVLNQIISPDGDLMATTSLSTVRLWDLRRQEQLMELQSPESALPLSAIFTSDNKRLYVFYANRAIRLFDLKDQRLLADRFAVYVPNYGVALSPDGEVLAFVGSDGGIHFFDLVKNAPQGPFFKSSTPGVAIETMSFRQNGRQLVFAETNGHVRTLDVASGTILGEFNYPRPINQITKHYDGIGRLSPDGRYLAAGYSNGSIELWDVQENNRVGDPIPAHRWNINGLLFSPDSKTLASLSYDNNGNSVRLWNMASRKMVGKEISIRLPGFVHLAFLRDSKALAVAVGGSIQLWSVADEPALAESLPPQTGYGIDPVLNPRGPNHVVAAFSPDGRVLAQARGDSIKLTSLDAERKVTLLEGQPSTVAGLTWTDKGKTVVSFGQDGVARRWSRQTGKLQGSTTFLQDAAFQIMTVNGDSFATATNIYLPDVPAGRAVIHLGKLFRPGSESRDINQKGFVKALALNPDGELLAIAPTGSKLQLFDIIKQRLEPLPSEGEDEAYSVEFSPNGKWLAAGAGDGTIRLWDVATRRRYGEVLRGNALIVSALAFSPDSKTLASSDFGTNIRLWDVEELRPLGDSSEAGIIDMNLRFSPDGRRLAAFGSGKPALLFNVDLESWEALACARANRNLSLPEWHHYFGQNVPYHRTCSSLPPGVGAPGS